MGPLDFIVLVLSGIGLAAYLCRLNALKFRKHSLVVIVLHISLCSTCIFVGYHAWEGDAGALEVAALVGALSWIWMSMPTWGKGAVPRQFETAPAPLDEARS